MSIGLTELFVLFIAPVGAILLALMLFKSFSNTRAKARGDSSDLSDTKNDANYSIWREHIRARGGVDPVYCPLPLEDGECCFFFTNTATLFVPAMPGDYFEDDGLIFETEFGESTGVGWSVLERFDAVKFVGGGRLYITDRRIGFVGSSTYMIPLHNIRRIAASCSGLMVASEVIDRPLVFGRINGQQLRDILHIMMEDML